jgi:hypothetical protein
MNKEEVSQQLTDNKEFDTQIWKDHTRESKSEHIYRVLHKKGVFNSMGWSEQSTKEQRAFCDFLSHLPHEAVLTIIKHGHGFFSPQTKNVLVCLDTGELYYLIKKNKNIVFSKNSIKNTQGTYIAYKTKKSPEEILEEVNKNYEQDITLSLEKSDEEEIFYIHFSNETIDDKEGIVIKNNGEWVK